MKLVIVGAGYAGTFVANRVARRTPNTDVVVINPRPFFVDRIRLHKHVAGTGIADASWPSMMHERVGLVVDTATQIGGRSVRTQTGASHDFDHAVIAVGSTVRPPAGTIAVGTWEQASRAREALRAVPAGGQVAVVGGGATGIETASEVAEARPDVHVRLIARELAPTISPSAATRLRQGLSTLSVEVIEDVFEGVDASDGAGPDHLRLGSGRRLVSNLTLWSIVSGVPTLVADSGLSVDDDGRALVDDCLRSVSNDRVFVIGDCAAVPGARMACQTALPQARHTADNLARLSRGQAPQAFRSTVPGLGVSLGRRDAVGQLTRRDGSIRSGYVSGPPAVLVKEIGARGAKFVTRAGRGV